MDPWVERELKQYTFLDLNAMVDGGATFSHRGDVAVVSWASGPSGPSGRQSHPFFRTYSHMEFKPGRLERYHVGVGEAWGKLCEVLALRLGVPEGPWEKRVYWSDPGGQVRFAVVWLRKEGLVGSVLPVASPSVVVPWLPLGYQERVLIVRPTVYEMLARGLPEQDQGGGVHLAERGPPGRGGSRVCGPEGSGGGRDGDAMGRGHGVPAAVGQRLPRGTHEGAGEEDHGPHGKAYDPALKGYGPPRSRGMNAQMTWEALTSDLIVSSCKRFVITVEKHKRSDARYRVARERVIRWAEVHDKVTKVTHKVSGVREAKKKAAELAAA